MRSLTDASRKHVAAGVLVVAGSFYVAFLLRDSYYFVDDFVRLSDARSSELGWSYLSSSVFGHFVPGWRLTFFVLQRAFPFRYGPVIIFESIVQGLTLIGLYRLLVALHGPRWRNLILTAMYAVSPIMLTSQFWFSNALHVMPSLCGTLWAADGFTRHLATGRPRYLAYSVLSAVVGLMFYEKPVILLLLLPLLILIIATEAGPLTEGLLGGLRCIVTRWRVWLAYVVPIGLYFGYFFAHGYYERAPRPSLSALTGAIWGAWTRGLSVFFIGGPYRWRVYGIAAMEKPAPHLVTIVLAQIAVVAVVAATLARHRRAWRGWALSVIIFVASFLIVAWGRLLSLGPAIGEDLRYTADIFAFVILGLSIALGPVRPGLLQAVRPATPTAQTPNFRLPTAAITILVVAYFVGAWINAAPYRAEWSQAVPRTYWTNFFRDLQSMKASGQSFSLYNTPVPPTVGFISKFPKNLLDVSVSIADPTISYNDPTKPMYAVDLADGHMYPARLAPLASQRREGTSACVAAGDHTVSFPLEKPLPLQVYFLHLSYRAEAPAHLGVFLHTDEGRKPGIGSQSIELPSERDALISTLAPGAIKSIELQVSTGGTLCLNEITIGLPAAASGGSPTGG